MKQQLVSIQKSLSTHCGFDLCPKKFKYLANPALLDKVFSNQIPRIESTVETKRPRHLEVMDSMYTTECSICKEEFLLPVENPMCTSCRRVYQ